MTNDSGSDQSLPGAGVVWGTVGAVLVFMGVSAAIFARTDPDLHLDLENFTVFAPIYAVAQAVERLLEPIAARLKPSGAEKQELKAAREEKLTAATSDAQANATTREEAASNALSKRRSERALIFFAIASSVSLVVTGVLGLGILQAMADQRLSDFLRAVDVMLTGLVIGAGTKPLHDLIARLEKSNDAVDPATQPTPAAGPVTPTPA
jgi:hypothetical protein